MSFDLYEAKTISYKLKSQSNQWKPCDVPNLLYRSTIGLGQLYSDIQLNQKLPTLLSNPRCFTNNEGYFETKSDLLLHKRYKLIEMIGQGASSMVYKAEDAITQQIVALKSVRQHYEILASREKLIIDHIQYSEGRSHPDLPIVTSLGWFHAKGHDFIVLPYYSHSLIEFISLGKTSTEGNNNLSGIQSASSSSEMKLNQSPLILVQPKPILSNRTVFNAANSSLHSSPYYSESIHSNAKNNLASALPENIFNEYDLINFKKIAFQLLTSIYILHKEGIIHADIKPENCFLHFPPQEMSGPGGNFQPNSIYSKITPDFHFRPRPSNTAPFTTNVSAISSFKWLRQLPTYFQIKLADFSNSIHTSEIPSYFQEFNIQSAPYRAPEVLIGIPFTAGIDLWSIGMILLELCLNKAFITTNEPKQIIQLIESKIGKFSKLRFSGGKYSHLLFESKFSHLETGPTSSVPSNPSSSSSSSIVSTSSSSLYSRTISKENHELLNYRLDAMKTIKRLLLKSTQFEISNIQLHELVDIIGQLLTIDPTQRISSKEALQHSFFSSLFPMPYQLIVPFQSNDLTETKKKKRARNNEHSAIQFESLKPISTILSSPSVGKVGLFNSSGNLSNSSGADFSPWKKKGGMTMEVSESKASI